MAAPSANYCSEKQRLIEAFTEAVTDYLRLESAQLEAVIGGHRFEAEDELREARKRKNATKRAIVEHQLVHQC